MSIRLPSTILTLALSLACTGANAQSATTLWDGPYAGALATYNTFETRWSSDESFYGDDNFNDSSITSPSKSSGGAGLMFGSNWVRGQLVYGLEADLASAGGTSRLTSDSSSAMPPELSLGTKFNYLGHIRGRVGYSIGNVLPYFGFGLAFAGVDFNTSLNSREEPHFDQLSESHKDLLMGISMAIGAEYAINKQWKVRGEYLMDRFSTASVQSYWVSDSFNAKPKINSLRIGVLYGF